MTPDTTRPPEIAASPGSWRRRHRWTIRLVVAAVLLAVVTLFAAANYVLVELRLILWTGEVRLSWALLGAGAVGFLLGFLLGLIARRRPWPRR